MRRSQLVKESFTSRPDVCIPCLHYACEWCTNIEANKQGYGIAKCHCPCEASGKYAD